MEQYPYLKDKKFLKRVDELQLTTLFARIHLLNWNESPIQEIQGKITGGNISINGDSSVRRTCNLNTYVEDEVYNYDTINSLFSLNKKVEIEIGIQNITTEYENYPILWFPQGIYIIMGISLNHQLEGTSISLTLKDKMVLLNGECGGVLPATVLFNEIEYNNDPTDIDKPTIYQLIKEAVNHYGGIEESKIIINDVDLEIRQVMRWMSDKPLYQKYTYRDGQRTYIYSLTQNSNAKVISAGDDIGYIYVPFCYPDELIGQAGENVCTILDKLKAVLGNYEYFFDLYGNFVFQEKKNYLNVRQTTFQLTNGLSTEDYLITNKQGINSYNFNNTKMIVSISNTPKYENIKNDFIVWGKRKGLDGTEIPIRYHLAIDKVPTLRSSSAHLILYQDEYKTDLARWYDGKVKAEEKEVNIEVKDWRTELYVEGLEADYDRSRSYTDYYIELMNEWRKCYDLEKGEYYDNVLTDPYKLDYYLDIIDENSIIGQYSIGNIGKRTQVLNDDTINCLFEPEIPDVVCIETGQQDTEEKIRQCVARGENYTQVSSEVYKNLMVGGLHNSAFVAIRDLLYQYTNYNENVNITMIPIFYLDSNIRISVIDEESGTNGDFIIQNITIPLSVTENMQITATRAMEKI